MIPESYHALLEEAWTAHLAPRSSDAPTVISTFAGCGGSSLGYSMAGYRELGAVEWDKHAAEVFRLNFPDVPVWEGDICDLKASELMRLAQIGPGELDVLDGSPPCQGFSTAGLRRMTDSRNLLFREYVRLLRELQPRAFVMENVSGLVKGKMRLVFAEMLLELKASGFRVSCRLMNAKWYRVPQDRARTIFIGVREDLRAGPSHPAAQARTVTVTEALRSVPADPDAYTVKPTTKIYRDMLRVRPGGSQLGHHSHIRLPENRPAPTILADAGFGHYHYWHPREHRVLTFQELRRLCSFPSHFRLTGTPGERWARIGNSVPPLFMRAIAGHVRTLLTSAETSRAA